MGFFDWIFKNKEKDNSSILLENIMFKNLRGVDFKNVNFTPKGDTPEKFLTSDIDGSWYYAHNQMVMLFKAFSKEKFDSSLNKLLDDNNIDYDSFIEKNTIKYWSGDGFKIESPPSLGSANLIIITNEDIVPNDALDFQQTKLTDKTYNLNWVKGFKIFDGTDILKKDYQFGKSLNVPAYFNENNDEYILIKVTTETIAKKLIDKIMENNGGSEIFKADDVEGWFYPHRSKLFTVGYLIQHSVVRINKLYSPKSHKLQTTDLVSELELPANIKINGIDHVYDFNKVDDINKLLHVPLLSTDNRVGDGKLIIIKSTSIEFCKNIIDDIISKNGGKENFEDVSTLGSSLFSSIGEYIHQNETFSLLIMPQYPAVRINLFTEGGFGKFEDF